MRTTSLTTLRKNLASAIDRAHADHEPVLITREGGKPSAVLMSLDDFASLEETKYLMSNPANARRLVKSVEELSRGAGTERQLAD
jgi:antitoxin YefM